mgnify:CR=1 FL=1
MTFPFKGSDNVDYAGLTSAEVTALFAAQNTLINSVITLITATNRRDSGQLRQERKPERQCPKSSLAPR